MPTKPVITAQVLQDHLDQWWSEPHPRARLSALRARLAKALAGTDAIVRAGVVDGQDGQGAVLQIEIESQGTVISRQFRPRTQPGAGAPTLDDVDEDGPSRRERQNGGGQ